MKKDFLLATVFSILTLFPATAQNDLDIWNLPELNVEKGQYTTDWDNLSRQYNVPAWWREAKLGAWSHWDPQSAAEDGDWYALRMYQEGRPQNKYHIEHYGHPSEFGYKDLCNEWKTDLWDPDDLMQLYIKMGAKYFLAMGNHHDNFDCWDSAYQPWNSVNVGPHQDIVGIWAETARKYGMPFGIGFHATPARTWGQFMTHVSLPTRKEIMQECLTMCSSLRKTEKENGGKDLTRKTFTVSSIITAATLSTHRSPTSS